MNIWGKNMPELMKIAKAGKQNFVKSGIIFSVKNGLAKLRKAAVNCDEDWTYRTILKLYGTPLLQYESGPCSTSPIRLAEGYGIEKADCEELKAIDAAINSEFTDIDHSFEAVKPLLGLLEDGIYLLADAEITPTDGEGHFFWDIDPKFHFYDATINDYYLGCARDLDILSSEILDPLFLYPSQSAALFNRKRADYYAELFMKSENPPRAIAYNFHGGMNVLLDGHHKAAAAAMLGQKLKCLLIIPSYEVYSSTKNGRSAKLGFTDKIYLKLEKSDADLDEIFRLPKPIEEIKAEEPCFADIMYRKRKWEDEFVNSAKKYPDALTNALEKHFDIPYRYDEIVQYLAENVTDRDGIMKYKSQDPFGFYTKNGNDPTNVLGLIIKKAQYNSDRRLKQTAIALFRYDYDYMLSADSLRYLMMFRDDSEVEEMFIGIVADASVYDRFGHIAADFWEDIAE